jgi:hypothetical protein
VSGTGDFAADLKLFTYDQRDVIAEQVDNVVRALANLGWAYVGFHYFYPAQVREWVLASEAYSRSIIDRPSTDQFVVAAIQLWLECRTLRMQIAEVLGEPGWWN